MLTNKKTLNRSEFLMNEIGILSKKEVASILQVTPCTINRYVKQGKLKVKKTAGEKSSKCYFLLNDVKKLLGI